MHSYFKNLRKHYLIYCFLFCAIGASGQKIFSLELIEDKRSLASNKTIGFSTYLDFSIAEVRKGWWKYSREFGNPLDMRDYYQVKIPSNLNDGNVDILVFSQSQESGKGTSFYMGIEDEKYSEQIMQIILSFKKRIYIDYYLDIIDKESTSASVLAKDYVRNQQPDLLNTIDTKQQIIENLKKSIKAIEKQ